MKEIHLITDDLPHTDGLGFKGYAEVLADAIRHVSGPFTIGIIGEWGAGKTTLMQMINEELMIKEESSHSSHLHTIWFNPWQYEYEENVLLSLIQKILHELPESGAGGRRTKIRDFLLAVFVALQPAIKSAVGALWGSMAADIAKGVGKSAERFIELGRSIAAKGEGATYEQLRNELRKRDDGPLKVVVFLDDLDRCLPKNAVQLIEKIKLILNIPDFVFVAGMSRSRIEHYVQDQYGHSNDPEFAVHYLDKLYQIAFQVPVARFQTDYFWKYTEGQLHSKISVADLQELKTCFSFAFTYTRFNPRMVKGIMNDTQIDRQLVVKLLGQGQAPQWSFFVVTRLLIRRWRPVYEWLLAQDETTWKDIYADPDRVFDAPLVSKIFGASHASSVLQAELVDTLRTFFKEKFVKEWVGNKKHRMRVTDYYHERLAVAHVSVSAPQPVWICTTGNISADWKALFEAIADENAIDGFNLKIVAESKFRSPDCPFPRVLVGESINPALLKSIREGLGTEIWKQMHLIECHEAAMPPSDTQKDLLIPRMRTLHLGETPSKERALNALRTLLKY
jgi:hypothetical protein